MLLDGTQLAATKQTALSQQVSQLPDQLGLGIVVATDDSATHTYIARKQAAGQAVGYKVTVANVGAGATANQLRDACAAFNQDPKITGYIVQLPLPEGIDQLEVLAAVDPNKDADGLTPLNLGYLAAARPRIIPATPKGVLSLLEANQIAVAGHLVTIVGKGLLTGAPLAALLSQRGATVTVCNRQTADLAAHTRSAEIIISAAGKPGLITADMVSEQTVIVDVGTTHVNGTLRGDVDFEPVAAKVRAISPVPGGVGPMTVISLLENVSELARLAPPSTSSSEQPRTVDTPKT